MLDERKAQVLDAIEEEAAMAAKIVPGDRFRLEFQSHAVSDKPKCVLSAAVGIEDGIVVTEPVAEMSEESPDTITIWGPLHGDGWQLDAKEFLRRLQHLVTAFDERRDA